ncbi:MAG: hypothetical protein NZ518_08610, partial [Dehalococcoidia bacterium]|nr:hypothetical protein [Dehalococcoidia bacterium]
QRALLSAFADATAELNATVADSDAKLREATAASEAQYRSAREEADKKFAGAQSVFERAQVFLTHESKLSKRDRQSRLDILLGAFLSGNDGAATTPVADPAREIADQTAVAERALRYLRYVQGNGGAFVRQSSTILTVLSGAVAAIGLALAVMGVVLNASPDLVRGALGLAGAGVALFVFANVVLALTREASFRNPAQAFEALSQSLTRARRAHHQWVKALKAEHQQRLEAAKQAYIDTVVEQKPRFEQIRQRFSADIAEEWQVVAQFAPRWDSAAWQSWTPTSVAAPVLLLGSLEAGRDPFLVSLPAFVPLQGTRGLLLKAPTTEAFAVTAALRAIVGRLVTAFPPGRARFGVIDTSEQGNLATLLRPLADYDESLVVDAGADVALIRQLLDDWTIDDSAGATRVLLVNGFPDGFNDMLAHRLLTLVKMAAERAILTVITLDTSRPTPSAVKASDFEQLLVTLRWADNRFVWHNPELTGATLKLEDPPSLELFGLIVAQVGQAAGRYSVLFEHL